MPVYSAWQPCCFTDCALLGGQLEQWLCCAQVGSASTWSPWGTSCPALCPVPPGMMPWGADACESAAGLDALCCLCWACPHPPEGAPAQLAPEHPSCTDTRLRSPCLRAQAAHGPHPGRGGGEVAAHAPGGQAAPGQAAAGQPADGEHHSSSSLLSFKRQQTSGLWCSAHNCLDLLTACALETTLALLRLCSQVSPALFF